ncbi:hypothetical protein HDV02_000044 [Globomyces sp. JEL0801]|nr:hypothetical protein HDV02_000044 [Globomyces sp. JEL0801]
MSMDETTIQDIDNELIRKLEGAQQSYNKDMARDTVLHQKGAVFNRAQRRANESNVQSRLFQLQETAPNFTLENSHCDWVTLDEITENKHVILLFCLGGWSVFCMIYVKAFQRVLTLFPEKQIAIIVITGENPETIQKNEQMYGIQIHYLSDCDFRVTKKYRINNQLRPEEVDAAEKLLDFNWKECFSRNSYCLPVPTGFVIQRKTRKIYFAQTSVDYVNRTKIVYFMNAIDQAKSDYDEMMSPNPHIPENMMLNLIGAEIELEASKGSNFDLIGGVIEAESAHNIFQDEELKQLKEKAKRKLLVKPAKHVSFGIVHSPYEFPQLSNYMFGMGANGSQRNGPLANEFTLKSHNGEIFELDKMAENKHLILVFYRGDWTLSDVKFMQSLNKAIKFFFGWQASMAIITSESHDIIIEAIITYGLQFLILLDPKNETSKAYGISKLQKVDHSHEALPWEHNSFHTDFTFIGVQQGTKRIFFPDPNNPDVIMLDDLCILMDALQDSVAPQQLLMKKRRSRVVK